ncbi:MAG: DNA polymerase [Planctomycetota bacterium]|nr:DNA polymerase [Planctomycetota bacterium]
MAALHDFRAIRLLDFEYRQPDGGRPEPHCMVAREFHTGRLLRLDADELRSLKAPPFPIDEENLFVAYYASAELGCFLELDWPMPARVLDLCAEFKNSTSGLAVPSGRGLLGALIYHGLDALAAVEKEEMRALAMRGGPFTLAEKAALLDYCQSDVDALAKLLPAMLPKIDLPRALLRGRYMTAAARMERIGIPIDVGTLDRLRRKWSGIRCALVDDVRCNYGLFDGITFKVDRFEQFLAANDIPWPYLPSGSPALDDDTFRSMAKAFPLLWSIRELRHALSSLRLNDLAVGPDGRNRCMLSAFGSKTGRNQPSNAKFIFGPSVWLRGLIAPVARRAVAYIDWGQQEFGIAAALSSDPAMFAAYLSGDPYLAFAKQAGAIPEHATKESHGDIRERFKQCILAVQYGMGAESLALRLSCNVADARQLLELHRRTYPVYWRWSQAAVDHAMLRGHLHTVFGWLVHAGPGANPRSLANFAMQANGAEMMRLAACLATERGIRVCAPVHDAFLIEAPITQIDAEVARMQACMAEASRIVLGGLELRTDAKIVMHPDRYMDKRGVEMWGRVMGILSRLEPVPMRDTHLSHHGIGTCGGVGHPLNLISCKGISNG